MTTNRSTSEDARAARVADEIANGSKRLRRGANGQPILNDQGEPLFDETPPITPGRTPRDDAFARERRQYVRAILDGAAGNPGLKTGGSIDATDRAAFITQVLDSAGKLPSSTKQVLADAVGRIADMVSAGSRGDAVKFARERATEIASELPRSFVIPQDDDDPAELAARVPR